MGILIIPQGGGGGGSARDAAVLSVLASAGASIDVIAAKTIVITMDANIVNMTFPTPPTLNGFPVVYAFDQNAVAAKTVSFDPASFRGGLDVSLPIIDATLSSRTWMVAVWNAKDSIFDVVDAARRYP